MWRAGDPRGAAALQEAQDAFEAAGGFEADKRIAGVLTGLGFKQSDWARSCSEFSGGWQACLLHITGLSETCFLEKRLCSGR